ncbi:UNVERIFIED_CONTAM: hypothetical protein FKN15_077667 [Acipenser sinensis]
MSFLLKAMIGNPMKNMAGGAEEEEKKKEEGSTPPDPPPPGPQAHSAMSFLLKAMIGNPMKNMAGGEEEEEKKKEEGDGKETPESKGMTREEFEEYQRQLMEEKIERDKQFAQKKAERASLRILMRDKHRLPQWSVLTPGVTGTAVACRSVLGLKRLALQSDLCHVRGTPDHRDRIERDKQFAQKKAERASLRILMRDKHRLPQSEKDDAQIQIVGGDVDLPEDLAKMVEQDEEEEEVNDSLLGKIQNMDFEVIKTKAQTTLTEMKEAAEETFILGFSKDQDPLLNPGGPGTHKSGMESLGDPGKPDPTNPYGHLSSLRDHSDHAAFHGKDLRKPLDLLVPRLHGASPLAG